MADVTIFDPPRSSTRATYLEPFQFSTGILHVMVNGQWCSRMAGTPGLIREVRFAIIAEDNRTRRFKRQA